MVYGAVWECDFDRALLVGVYFFASPQALGLVGCFSHLVIMFGVMLVCASDLLYWCATLAKPWSATLVFRRHLVLAWPGLTL